MKFKFLFDFLLDIYNYEYDSTKQPIYSVYEYYLEDNKKIGGAVHIYHNRARLSGFLSLGTNVNIRFFIDNDIEIPRLEYLSASGTYNACLLLNETADYQRNIFSYRFIGDDDGYQDIDIGEESLFQASLVYDFVPEHIEPLHKIYWDLYKEYNHLFSTGIGLVLAGEPELFLHDFEGAKIVVQNVKHDYFKYE